jgi:hypothetical protein
MRRTENGIPQLITPDQWMSWQQMHGEHIHPHEWLILRNMDKVYVATKREEIADQIARASA